MAIVKLKGQEVACNTTPSTFGGARLVRLTNIHASNFILVTHRDDANTVLGSMTVTPATSVTLEKTYTDTLESNNNTLLLGVSVGFSN